MRWEPLLNRATKVEIIYECGTVAEPTVWGVDLMAGAFQLCMHSSHPRICLSKSLWKNLVVFVLSWPVWGVVASVALAGGQPLDELAPELAAAVRRDWFRQEARRVDQPGSLQSLERLVARAEATLQGMSSRLAAETLQSRKATVDQWKKATGLLRSSTTAVEGRRDEELYNNIRGTLRQWVLQDAGIGRFPILFLKTRRFVCQMIHEYVGHYYNVADLRGGGVYVLEEPGRSMKVRSLTEGRLPPGAYQTLALDYEAHRAYFAYVEVRSGVRDRPVRPNWQMLTSAPLPPEWDYQGAGRQSFHLYELELDTGQIKQLTFGREDDISPCPLPDGDLVFLSSRRGGYCRCNNWWEPLPTYTLHRLDRETGEIITLSYHETNEWHPAVLNDGRICYSRWDYVDRSAAHFHGLWTCLPDGTGARAIFGNYTMDISACFQPRAIPGSQKIAFIAGAHHAIVGGALVLFDPRKALLDRASGEDRFECLENLTPDIEFPETPNEWPAGYFASPWPLSEDCFLVAFGYERLPGIGSGHAREEGTGIYYYDRWGNLELLYIDEGFACLDPIPLVPRPKPSIMPLVSSADPQKETAEEGEAFVYIVDVTRSHLPFPADVRVDHLRVFQLFPKSTPAVNDPRIGHANAENARALLGTVPIEADGSAYFRVPAGKPLYFQVVDTTGKAIQGMRSTVYFRPGERVGCVGCHEPQPQAPPDRLPMAIRRPPSELVPGPDGTRPFHFVRLIQPILDRHCVRCHNSGGSQGGTISVNTRGPVAAKPDLTGKPEGLFTRAYNNLRPYVAFFEWGGASIDQIVTRPGRMGARMSRLAAIIDDSLHRQEVRLSDQERRVIYLWLDANVPFYGTYDRALQAAQLRGEIIPVPEIE
ncbi:MAG: hypothetical protein NZ899_10330 [Thermoguttaceae bacterium]|nr:hypothetical protein [Thermoguttaceae bacterium]MDW8078198.1 hypothetical protein [Thermoguttaceae bacterium]